MKRKAKEDRSTTCLNCNTSLDISEKILSFLWTVKFDKKSYYP